MGASGENLDWRLGGVLLGLLLVAAVAVFQPIGVSTAYCTTWGMALAQVAPAWARNHPYLRAVGTAVTPEWVLVLGLVAGAASAATVSRSGARAAVPAVWASRFGAGRGRRFLAAFAGGFLFLFGARLAGGCTSGHVISGISQLAVSGLVFAAGVFASGMLTARLVYGKGD